VQFVTDQPIHGASAGLNVWKPHVDIKGGSIFSLFQIWVINQHKTMEAGWIVVAVYLNILTILYMSNENNIFELFLLGKN